MLTDMKKRFADHYLVELNATAAAKLAGYSEKTAYSQGQRLLKDVDVRAYIEPRQQKISDELEIDAKWVQQKLVTVTERCMQAEPVMKWDYGEKKLVETGEYAFDSQGANKALELLGKSKGMFIEKHEHSGRMVVIKGEGDLED